MKNKLLITGSCGFIMSSLVRKLFKDNQYSNNYIVSSLDRVNYNLNSMYFNRDHMFYPADIRDQHILNTIFELERPDIVIHGAAETFVDTSLKDPNSFASSNVLGTQALLNASVKFGVKRFIYISTDEVYGSLSSEEEASWNEESKLNPRNPYSASKAAGELMVKAAHESFGLQYNITRSANNYGVRQNKEKLLPKVVDCILNEQKIPLYGKGAQIRDWTHVFDNCDGIMKVIENGEPNQIYNISANQELSNVELVQKICNIMNKGHDLISFVEDPRKSHDFRYSIDCSKIKSIGWQPRIKLKDGLYDTVEWYKNNPWFLR